VTLVEYTVFRTVVVPELVGSASARRGMRTMRRKATKRWRNIVNRGFGKEKKKVRFFSLGRSEFSRGKKVFLG